LIIVGDGFFVMNIATAKCCTESSWHVAQTTAAICKRSKGNADGNTLFAVFSFLVLVKQHLIKLLLSKIIFCGNTAVLAAL